MSDTRWYEKYQVDLPCGQAGYYAVERFEVSVEDEKLDRLRSMIGGHGRFCEAGQYTRLVQSGVLLMSDTQDEIRDHLEPIRMAKGIDSIR